MTFAAILAFHLLSLGWTPSSVRGLAADALELVRSEASSRQSQSSAPQPQPETPASAQPPSATPGPQQTPTSPVMPSPTRPRRRKTTPNCSTAPAPLNPSADNSADSKKATGAASVKTGSPNAASTNTASTTLKPCPPSKKVIRNGGSSEPVEQLTGGTKAQQDSQQHSTEELTAATEENLKKIAGLQLTPSQQDMVNHIKQFMEQSKAAVAAGDLDGAHNFARKAHLLSEELVKP
jgi:hypothetical protein